MNKYIYIGFLFLLLGCQKEGIVSFDQKKDCIQFNYDPQETKWCWSMILRFRVLLVKMSGVIQLTFIWAIRFPGILFLYFYH